MCIPILLSYIFLLKSTSFPPPFHFWGGVGGGGVDGCFLFVIRGSVGNSRLSPYQCQNAACSSDFFSLAGRLCSGGLRFDWANLIFADFFIVSGRDDLPSDAGKKIFSDLFWNANLSLRLNKDFRSCSPKWLLDRNNYKRFPFCPWMWRFPAMFSHYHFLAFLTGC